MRGARFSFQSLTDDELEMINLITRAEILNRKINGGH
jgi:hypothetical protein